jgi:cytochrome c
MKTAMLVFLLAVSAGAEDGPGKQLFARRCAGCHDPDRDKEGPRLRGVYGRRAAAVPAFPYSQGLRKAQLTWDAASLEEWLTNPESLAPDTTMAFRLVKPEERAAIIAYLKELSGR